MCKRNRAPRTFPPRICFSSFIAGNRKLVKETVPLYTKLIIKCNFDSPIWYRNGKLIPNDPKRSKSLRFESVRKTDAGYYSCGSVYNEWSNLTLSVFSRETDHYQSDGVVGVANLERKSLQGAVPAALDPTDIDDNELKEGPPRLLGGTKQRNHLQQDVREVGESYRLQCDAVGQPEPYIRWLKNGKDYQDNLQESTIVFRQLVSSDAGVYVCQVCNRHGCVNSTTVLEVRDHQDVAYLQHNNMESHSQLQEDLQTAHEQDKARKMQLFASATSNHQTAPIGGGVDEDDDEDDEDDEDIGQDGMDGNHEGDATNSAGASNRSTTPPVDSAPYFVKKEHMAKLVPKPSGSFVRLRCPAEGYPKPNITWTKDGRDIERSMGQAKKVNWAIVLEDLVPDDSGFYTCHVCNRVGCVNFTTKLEVNDRFPARPHFIEPLRSITALVNTTVVFRSRILSDLEPHIVWGKFRVEDMDNASIPENATMLEVFVRNRVNHKPIITKSLTNVTVVVGDNVTMECTVLSDLTAHIQWIKYYGICSVDCVDIKKTKRDPDNPEVLTLTNVTHADEGWYTCVAANSLGASYDSAYLRVVDELPPDDTPTAHPVRTHSVLITVMTFVLCGCFMVLAIVVIVVCKKLKREKMKHRAMEHVNQWTKKVIVLKQAAVEGSIPGMTDALCFAAGAEIGPHRNDHSYQFMDSGILSIFRGKGGWSAREELHLLDAIEQYGFGNWEDISKHIETRTPEEAKEEYVSKFLNGTIGRHTWQVAVDQRPILTDHTSDDTGPLSQLLIQKLPPMDCTPEEAAALGYMPNRDDFEREYDPTAEQLVSTLSLQPDDEDVDMLLKLAQVDIYTRRLRERARRKRVVRDYQLVANFFRGNMKRARQTRDQREFRERLRTYSQFYTSLEFERLISSLERERALRIRLSELNRYRWNGIQRVDECVHFEQHVAAAQYRNTGPYGHGRTAPKMKEKKEEILVKMHINGENDIDVVPIEKAIDSNSDSEEETFSDVLDSEPELVATSDGRMMLELKRNRFCTRCKKPFKTAEEQKAHKAKCTGVVDEIHDVIQKERKAAKYANPSEEFRKYCNPNPENPCYCCGEDVSTAHVGHIRCRLCPKSFKAYEYLDRHISSIHAESETYACLNCNAKCSSQSVLDEHVKTHNEGKPFSCITCDYQCPTCSKTFAVNSALSEHMKTHIVQKPVTCTICNGSFIRNDCLVRHMKAKHREDCQEFLEQQEESPVPEVANESTVEINGEVYQITSMDEQVAESILHEEVEFMELDVVAEESVETAGGATIIATADDIIAGGDETLDAASEIVNVKQESAVVAAKKKRIEMQSRTYPKTKAENRATTAVPAANKIRNARTTTVKVVQTTATSSSSAIKPDKREPVRELNSTKARAVKSRSVPAKQSPPEDDSIPIFLSDAMLMEKISELLQMLIGEEMLKEFGWPKAPVDEVLVRVISRCGQQPAKGEEVGDHTTRMRENTKILFAVTMDDGDVKALLNNHTVDEVIMHVLKSK
uniref:receptor protein-tyrosine kinase n=1 Tax=Anopheles albimanus TaxID=7167 RepID=A0A182F986_ANOAL